MEIQDQKKSIWKVIWNIGWYIAGINILIFFINAGLGVGRSPIGSIAIFIVSFIAVYFAIKWGVEKSIQQGIVDASKVFRISLTIGLLPVIVSFFSSLWSLGTAGTGVISGTTTLLYYFYAPRIIADFFQSFWGGLFGSVVTYILLSKALFGSAQSSAKTFSKLFAVIVILLLANFMNAAILIKAFGLKYSEASKLEIPKTEPPAPITENSNWTMYTDNNFDYSFYYPKTWKVSATDTRVTITNFGWTRNDKFPDSISISEVQDSKAFVTDSKFGNTTLYYDNNLSQWMKTFPAAEELYETKPAKVAFNTISGLSVYSSTGRWKTVIIPLSHTKFLVLNITGSGYTTALDLLASAVTEVGVNVPISAINDVISAMEKEDELAPGVEGTVKIYSLNPNSGPAGTQITISGKGFLSVPSARLQQDEQWQKGNRVTVSLVSYPSTALAKSGSFWIGIPSSDTSVTLTIPARACGRAINPSSQEVCTFYTIITPGTYTISVNVYGQQNSNEMQFTVTGQAISDAPVITSLEPSSGSVDTQVTIHGYNFTGREGINIGRVPLGATPSYVSPDGTRLIFTMPSSTQRFPGNNYPVTLTGDNGGAISNSLMFTLQ